MKPKIDEDTCIGCSACVTACPTNALEMKDGISCLENPDLCEGNGKCEEVCPVGAIELVE